MKVYIVSQHMMDCAGLDDSVKVFKDVLLATTFKKALEDKFRSEPFKWAEIRETELIE